MDANKLAEIIALLEADESEFGFGSKIQEIRTLISQGNEESNKRIEALQSEVEALVKLSRAGQFAGTEIETLKHLAADRYFGSSLVRNLQKILGSRAYAIQGELDKFLSGRSAKLSQFTSLKNAFSQVGLVAYKQTSEEISLILPDDKSNVSEVSEYLTEFGRLVDALQRCKIPDGGEALPQPRISRLSRGTLEFFVNVDPTVAESMLHCLGDLATLYLTIKGLRSKKEDPMLSEDEKKEVGKIYEKAAHRKVEEFLTATVEKVAPAASNENKASLRTYLKLLLKWIPLGVHVEVVYSKSTEPIQKDEKGQLDATKTKAMNALSSQQLKVTDMYKLPPEQLKLPDSNDDEPTPIV